MTEFQACRKISGEEGEFANICGPYCDPDLCEERYRGTPSPTLAPHTPPLVPETPLYCFREYEDRVRFENAWGDYILEVKNHPNDETCGPSFNLFDEDLVEFVNEQLTLRFEKKDGVWSGSEVRIVLPAEQMPYTYGTYQFSVKTVTVKDKVSGEVLDDALPPSLVLGMFTWDTTDKWDENEYWSHEVDIEISRWGNPDIMDAQFVIQPPEWPHFYRFQTGANGTLDQGGHTYQFTWKPTSVNWYTDANGGQSLTYTTEQSIFEGLSDRIQCLPADVEVRINLWNIYGTDPPTEMEDTHVAEVVIDGFSFTPSGETGVEDGEYCSKHCQCLGTSLCINGLCTSSP